MRRNNESRIHRFLYSRAMLAASAVVCAVIFFQLATMAQKSSETDQEIARLRDQKTKLEIEHKRLEELRSFLQTDYFAESEARTKFGYKKEGETAIVIIEPPSSAYDTNNPRALSFAKDRELELFKDRGTPLLWWDYFFDHRDRELTR